MFFTTGSMYNNAGLGNRWDRSQVKSGYNLRRITDLGPVGQTLVYISAPSASINPTRGISQSHANRPVPFCTSSPLNHYFTCLLRLAGSGVQARDPRKTTLDCPGRRIKRGGDWSHPNASMCGTSSQHFHCLCYMSLPYTKYLHYLLTIRQRNVLPVLRRLTRPVRPGENDRRPRRWLRQPPVAAAGAAHWDYAAPGFPEKNEKESRFLKCIEGLTEQRTHPLHISHDGRDTRNKDRPDLRP